MTFTIKISVERQIEIEVEYEEDGDQVTILNAGNAVNLPLTPSEVVQARVEALKEVRKRRKENKR